MENNKKNLTDKQTIFALLAYIAGHGFDACFTDGKLLALNTYTKREGDRVVVLQCWEEIKPTLADVRAWLGY